MGTTKCNKTAAYSTTYDNCGSQTLQGRWCSKTKLFELVPSGDIRCCNMRWPE